METLDLWMGVLFVAGLVVMAAVVIEAVLWELLVTRPARRFKKTILDDVLWHCDRRYARKRRGSA